MTDLDMDQFAKGLLNDAKIIRVAPAELLSNHLEWLIEAQDEIARAIEKARNFNERKAA